MSFLIQDFSKSLGTGSPSEEPTQEGADLYHKSCYALALELLLFNYRFKMEYVEEAGCLH